ncbi:RING finger protein 151 isoform X1 [Pygocentrus nattereri]|uniref:RING finger protein 151 isoform X1 n=1 Tax=Pygocentrus nattereri TaxID=42514 RepID=UPI00189122B6|nr:RING finger protein 151 isoform X1 [Pygocentrus nattereri]
MGYDVERFVGYVNEGLLCCVCRDVLEDPLQAPCEHAFCSTCIHAWLVHHHNCPEDRLPLDVTNLRPLYRYMRNDLARLQVRCVYRPQGCEVICALESIHRHEQDCDFALLNCSNAGEEYLCYRCGRFTCCPVQVSRHSLEAHLCVCEYRNRMCASGCGYTLTSTEEAQHNCISELRAELDLLRAELDCKVEEVRHEMESWLDSQRRYMVQKESLLKNEVDELKGQLSRVMSDVRVLLGVERARRQELERAELEKAELLELLKKEGLRPATPTQTATPPAEGPRKSSPRSLALDCIKRKSREVTVI